MLTVIAVVFVGVPCGAEGWDEIVLFAEGRLAWMSSWLDLRNGIPSAVTLRRVFQRLDPKAFAEGMRGWMLSIAGDHESNVVAIDGETLRGGGQRADVPLHMVQVWAVGARVLLASGSTECAPCFEAIEAAGELDELTRQWAEGAPRGREEARRVFVVKAEDADLGDEALPGLRSLVMIQRARLVAGSPSVERQYYVSSHAPAWLLAGRSRRGTPERPASRITGVTRSPVNGAVHRDARERGRARPERRAELKSARKK